MNQNPEYQRKRKIVLVTVVMAVAIVCLLVVIGTLATGRRPFSKPANESETTQVDDGTTPAESDGEVAPGDTTEESTDSAEGSSDTNDTASASDQEEVEVATDYLPATGPADALPLALIAGSAVTYAGSAVLARRNA